MLQQILRKSRTAWKLPLREKVWLILLFPYSGFIRASTYIFPFRIFSKALGLHYQNHTLSTVVTEQQRMLAWRIGKIVELATRATPWEAKCLVQAAMARTLLGYYHIPYVLHIGARITHEESEPLKAHAWVKVGPRVIIGGGGLQAFGIVSTFISPTLLSNNE
tara:strand:- start:111 stop:599 length:489 start_codon:yes stop_codon:yes gene_type:complete